ncbi:RNA-directed DNA polymerase, eukaryota [Tanacetum coccineum]
MVAVNRKNHIVRVQEIVAWSTQIMDDTVSEDATSENDEEVSDIEEELYLVDENIKEVDEFEKELKGKWTNSDDMHFMINIYGPRDTYDKAVLWNSVCLFTQTHNDKFMSFGDLNEVRDESERYGSTFSRLEADCFNSFIEVMNLVSIINEIQDLKAMMLERDSDREERLNLIQECEELDHVTGLDLAQKAHAQRDVEGDKT